MKETVWLRAETKDQEARSALAPDQIRQLISADFEIVVERSEQRAIDDSAFSDTGCAMVDTGSWRDAPLDAWILGLKELPEEDFALSHRHIYFAHAYKKQQGWQNLLRRFKQGGGELFDLEYLVHNNGRRVAAFGYWAGFAGCAVGLKIWMGQQLDRKPVITELQSYDNKASMLAELGEELAGINARPKIIVIGAKGRVGAGALHFAQDLGLATTNWDMDETAKGGPFAEVLQHEIFINCVLVQHKIPPFLTHDTLLEANRKLSVICDVSCDPGIFNPIPIYSETTTFSEPVVEINAGEKELYLSAIDHLPSLLPVESSEDFADQLLPHLLALSDDSDNVWSRAGKIFHEKSSNL
ncbi:MAG: saccharopine dehydrogenase [Pseudomonadales bacterium]|nr:saccharopine dehydrogenase [Pseudomonadales bacterium]